MTSTTDANGATTTRTYDVLGRPTSAISVRSGVPSEQVSWTYDTKTCSFTTKCLKPGFGASITIPVHASAGFIFNAQCVQDITGWSVGFELVKTAGPPPKDVGFGGGAGVALGLPSKAVQIGGQGGVQYGSSTAIPICKTSLNYCN